MGRIERTLSYARVAFLALALEGFGCSPRERTPSMTAAPPIDASIAEAAAALPSHPHWSHSIRARRWTEARTALDALPPDERAKPEHRYARARVAKELGDAKQTLDELNGLESALPLLADSILEIRAEAQLETGPLEQAGDFLLSRSKPAAWLRAARAFSKASLDARARASCHRILGLKRLPRALEAEARAIRIAHTQDESARHDDARWLVVHAPDLPFAQSSETLREQGKFALSLTERLERARTLADAGQTDRAIDTLVAAKTVGLRDAALARARGDVLWRSRQHYGEAASFFLQAAQAGGKDAAEDLFRAARALARADRDDEAIQTYRSVIRRFAKTSWADQAAFQVARLAFLHARHHESLRDFEAYLKMYPQGGERKEAMRGRALSLLFVERYADARKAFESLEPNPDSFDGLRAASLAATAALGEGDRAYAVGRWTRIARTSALTWPGLVARARLKSLKAAVPPAFEGGTEPTQTGRVDLPPVVDLLHRMGFDDDAEDALQERESVVTARARGGETKALCEAYGELDRADRRTRIAQDVAAHLLHAAPTTQNRWAWECAYPRPYTHLLPADVSRDLVYAIARQESQFHPGAISPASAVGLMQLLPETAEATAKRISVAFEPATLQRPDVNLLLGAAYLKELVDRFSPHLALAIAAYNAGPDAVARWQTRLRGADTDVFVESIPYVETREYVTRVLGNLARYGYLASGDAGIPDLPPRLN